MRRITSVFAILLMFAATVAGQVPGSWKTTGIGGGGALYSPSINPANHNEIYMGCDMSELFHSTDMGVTWNEVNFLTLQGGHDAAVQFTSDPLIRYTVDYTSVAGNDGLRPKKSTDGGTTWSVLPGNPFPSYPNGYVLRLFADWNNPGHLVMADYGTIYYSADGGNTFHQVHTCLSTGAGNHIAGVFFDTGNIYIGTNDGLLVSSNAGQTFSAMTMTGIPAGEYMLSFAGARQAGSIRFICLTTSNVWAGYQFGSNYWGAMKGVYRMDNGSGTWVSQKTGITAGSDFPVFVGMAANNIDLAWLAGGSSSGNPVVMKSVGGGAWTHTFLTANNQNIITGWCGFGGDHSWSFAEAPFGFTVAFDDANTVMFTDYACAHITSDRGLTWNQQYLDPSGAHPMNAPTPTGKKYRSAGLENTSCWQILWTDSLHMFAGFSDINGIMSDDKGQQWKFIPNLTQNTVYCVAKHPNGTLYAATSSVHDIYQSTRIYDAQIDAGTGAVFYSTDNGGSFSILHNFNHPVVWVAIDPANPSRMYASVLHHNKESIGGIWVTNNLGAGSASTWSKMANPPICNGHPNMINVIGNGDLVVTYSARKPTSGTPFTDSSGVCYYDNAAATWHVRSHPNMRFWTQDVVIDPNTDSQSLWYACVFEGWGTSGISGTGGLYRTYDRGLTWTRINDNFRVNSCTVKPGNLDDLYFSTETDGLWHCADATSGTPHFSQVTGYPFRHPMRIFYNPYKTGDLWVTSFGNGIKQGVASGPASIPDQTTSVETIRVFPQPATDFVTFELTSTSTGSNEKRVVISDLTGHEVLNIPWKKDLKSVRVPLSGLPDGIWIYAIGERGQTVATGKFVKFK